MRADELIRYGAGGIDVDATLRARAGGLFTRRREMVAMLEPLARELVSAVRAGETPQVGNLVVVLDAIDAHDRQQREKMDAADAERVAFAQEVHKIQASSVVKTVASGMRCDRMVCSRMATYIVRDDRLNGPAFQCWQHVKGVVERLARENVEAAAKAVRP